MTDKELVIELIKRGSNADDGYFQYAHIVSCLLPKQLHESLRQLVSGPVDDGDVISKSQRDELIDYGLGTRCCVKGEQGYTAATYFALTVLKAINVTHKEEKAIKPDNFTEHGFHLVVAELPTLEDAESDFRRLCAELHGQSVLTIMDILKRNLANKIKFSILHPLS